MHAQDSLVLLWTMHTRCWVAVYIVSVNGRVAAFVLFAAIPLFYAWQEQLWMLDNVSVLIYTIY
jgi:hypothetical protein